MTPSRFRRTLCLIPVADALTGLRSDEVPHACTTSFPYMPINACPGIPHTYQYVPAVDAVNVNVALSPGGTPVYGFGVSAPGNAGTGLKPTPYGGPEDDITRLLFDASSMLEKYTVTAAPVFTTTVGFVSPPM